MAAILVAIAVMSIVLTAALPVWKHEMQREKEEELIFRGLQYVRAIGLYVKRYGPGNFPPSVDVLVQQKFLRKKYKDPITGDDFQLLYMGSLQQQPGQPGQPGQQGQPGRPGAAPTPAQPQPQRPGTQLTSGGIMGVASKSKAESIRIYNGRTHYNEWQFLYAALSGRPGGPGAIRPGGPGRARPGSPMGPGSNRPGGPGPMGPPPMPPPRPPGG